MAVRLLQLAQSGERDPANLRATAVFGVVAVDSCDRRPPAASVRRAADSPAGRKRATDSQPPALTRRSINDAEIELDRSAYPPNHGRGLSAVPTSHPVANSPRERPLPSIGNANPHGVDSA
jgi:hypothetical protein